MITSSFQTSNNPRSPKMAIVTLAEDNISTIMKAPQAVWVGKERRGLAMLLHVWTTSIPVYKKGYHVTFPKLVLFSSCYMSHLRARIVENWQESTIVVENSLAWGKVRQESQKIDESGRESTTLDDSKRE